MTLQLGASIVALFAVPLSAAFGCGVVITYLLEEHHYRDYHK